MKLSKFLTAAGISSLLAFSAGAVLADDAGWYIGASANRLSADQNDIDDVDFEDSDNALGLKGGYMFNDLLGLELGYIDLGDYNTLSNDKGVDLSLDAEAITLAGVLNLSLGESWDVYGKLGVATLDSNTDLNIDDADTRAFGGIGVELDLGQVNIFGEYDTIDTDINDLTVDVVSVGLKYEF